MAIQQGDCTSLAFVIRDLATILCSGVLGVCSRNSIADDLGYEIVVQCYCNRVRNGSSLCDDEAKKDEQRSVGEKLARSEKVSEATAWTLTNLPIMGEAYGYCW